MADRLPEPCVRRQVSEHPALIQQRIDIPGRRQQRKSGAHGVIARVLGRNIAPDLAGGKSAVGQNRPLARQKQQAAFDPAKLEKPHGFRHDRQSQPKG